MIQRIQSVYIALAIVLPVVCCLMPLATFEPAGVGAYSVMYSMVLIDGSGAIKSYLPIVLFLLTILSELTLIAALFDYKHRRRQMSLCKVAIICELLWIAAYVVLCVYLREDYILHVKAVAFIPVVAIVLTLLAHRRIKKDEELVRSADRIR